MGATDTSFSLVSDSDWPGSPGADFYVVIDYNIDGSEEKILCSSNAGTTVNVASSGRGADGTSATTHLAGANVFVCLAAQDGDEANQIANLLGNLATGGMLYGAGSAALPNVLDIGSEGAIVISSGLVPEYLGIGSAHTVPYSNGTTLLFGSVQVAAGDTGWVTPTLGNNYTAGTPAPQYRVTGNVVRLRGQLVAGSASANLAAWTLPGTAVPTETFEQIVGTPSSGFQNFIIQTSGAVEATVDSVTNFLDGITFTTD